MGKEKSAEQKNKEEKQATLKNIGIVSAATEIIQRYGSANKEHIVSYTGVDNEAGKTLTKSLKSISEQKIHPDYVKQNIKQQAGFSAEVKEVARYNAETIINGENTYNDRWKLDDVGLPEYFSFNVHGDNIRKVRTEDIGMGNDPLFDHVLIDENGKILSYSGSQMKFTGKTPEEALDKLMSKKFQKYLDADISIEVPSDFYDGIYDLAQEKIVKITWEIKELEMMGKIDIAKQKAKELEKYVKVYENLQKSTVSNTDAVEARLDPKLSVAKDIVKVSHRAGVEAAKWGAVSGGSVSLVKNLVAVIKDEKSPKEASIDVVKDIGKGTVLSYTSAFTGATVKGLMQNASNATIRTLSKTNLPGLLITTTVETGKTLFKYFKGEIDGVTCLNELGEKGSGLIASSLFSALGVAGAVSLVGKSVLIGQLAIPIPVVGGLIGGTIGYALNSACYGILVKSLNEAKLAKEERIRIEAECREAILLIRKNRVELELLVSKYLTEHMETFKNAFAGIKKGIEEDNIDGFIDSMSIIPKYLGKEVHFKNFDEFIKLMESEKPLKL